MKKIMNIEGIEIYRAIKEGQKIEKHDYMFTCTVPNSLELDELMNTLTSTVKDEKDKEKIRNKNLLDCIINVTFEKRKPYIPYLHEDGEIVTKEYVNSKGEEREVPLYDKDKTKRISSDDVRNYLYLNGFTVGSKKYILYKRSSSKSRTGSCWFINEKLFNHMRSWSWLGKKLNKLEENCPDLAGYRCYESLTSSALEGTVKINPYGILLVEDLESMVEEECMVSYLQDKELITKKRKEKIFNAIFDGEGLIDDKLISHSMALLRNKWFKSCGLATDIQGFFKYYFKDKYETATVRDIFGNEFKVQDILYITTPNSLKFLKTYEMFKGNNDFERKKNCFDYWREHISDVFGICKHDKSSKTGTYQRMSYQMIQSLNLNKEELKELMKDEFDYINNIKNNIAYFKNHISLNDNSPTRRMMSEILERNTNFKGTKLFKTWRDNENREYIDSLRKGKIKINNADYFTIFSNVYELLLHSVQDFNVDDGSKTLQNNECYCSAFEDKLGLGVFRNPIINQGNTLYYVNRKTFDTDWLKYFRTDGNIILVNNCNINYMEKGQSFDMDSDTFYVTSNHIITEKCKVNVEKYLTPLNKIERKNTPRKWNNKDMSEVDISIAENMIGKLTNASQRINAQYWHEYNKENSNEKKLDELYKLSCELSNLTGLEIDKAKKFFELDIKAQLKKIEKNPILKKNKGRVQNPLFFKWLGKKNCKHLNCSMDFLIDVIEEEKIKADDVKNVNLVDILVEDSVRKANYHQPKKIIELITKYDKQLKGLRTQLTNEENELKKDVIKNKIEYLIKSTTESIDKLKINKETILCILRELEEKYSSVKVNTLSLLYNSTKYKSMLLECFKEELLTGEKLEQNNDGEISIWGVRYNQI